MQLFVAAASITVGLIAIGFSLIRRRFDRLLSFFAWFAAQYGFRLWMQSGIFSLMAGPSVAINRLQMAINFFVAIPAFLFFEASGLVGRGGRQIVYAACLLELCLIAAIFLGVPLPWLNNANSVLVIVGSALLVSLAFRQPALTADAIVFRAGMTVFITLVLWTNIVRLLGYRAAYEFYGFAVLMGCLAYIAARRALDRDQQLSSIRQELEIARRIQLSILPAAAPAAKHFSIAARYKPMTSVAGDFYDFLEDENGAVGLLVADVSGHGVPAALIASMVKVAIKTQRHRQNDPAALLVGVNEALCGNAQSQFVTAGYVYLNPNTDQFCYAAAGHPPMILQRARQIVRIEENGLVLALLPSAAYTSTTQPLQPGDRILLYTDGIIEAANANEEEFGQERLGHLLLESDGKTAEQTAQLIESAVTAWSPTQNDDLTIIVCDYQPISTR
ncbi:PP2C family protein-serine/threonine phosphatase [Terracidiphilus gabretensis]|uniref:PP2C family protein-serine/threonine phosphatase n=1 Tax=Terracidiphilus gabretensis TaxID=1577687 RepID=UPI0012FB6AA1|nr:PP2C family protein-serine/threonine phosphatase [Terracidiphilus gabretensis]